MTIDPHDMARFLVLEGASDLIQAFSRIPTGGVRQSVINLAQELASAYSASPPEHTAPDPLLGLPRHVGEVHVNAKAKAVEATTTAKKGGGLKATSPEGRAVERRLRGEAPKAISEAEGLPLWRVSKLFRDAREQGVVFPVLREAGRKPGPGDQQRTFPISADELSGQGLALARKAAESRGITLEAYMERRRLFLGMAKDNEPRDKIAGACGETVKGISVWFSNARAAGLLPQWGAEFRSEHKEVA